MDHLPLQHPLQQQDRKFNQQLDNNMQRAQNILEIDQKRQQTEKALQRRQILDAAYKLVDQRQKNIDEMMKHIHVINNKPSYLTPEMAAQRRLPYIPPHPNANSAMSNASPASHAGKMIMSPQTHAGPYNLQQHHPPVMQGVTPQVPQSLYNRANSLPVLPQYHQQPMSYPYQQQQQPQPIIIHHIHPQQAYVPPAGRNSVENPYADPMQQPDQQPQTGLSYIPSQHQRNDVRQVLDYNTLDAQTSNLAAIENQRKKILAEFNNFKSNEIKTRENQQKQYYQNIQSQLEANAKKEAELQQSLQTQQALIFSMMKSVTEDQEKSLSQKEKNEQLMMQIKKFETKNRNMKKRLNRNVFLSLGNQIIDQMPKGNDAELENQITTKEMFQELIEGRKKKNAAIDIEDEEDEDPLENYDDNMTVKF